MPVYPSLHLAHMGMHRKIRQSSIRNKLASASYSMPNTY